MSSAQRPRLSLPVQRAPELPEEKVVDLDVFDVLLPCRTFTVTYKVAEVGKVSLTAEYLLRLLRAVDGMDEDDVASFFGFNRRELTFVLGEAESHDFVERREGRLWLTRTGRGLFVNDDEEPHIYEVEKRTERVDFDLIAFAPQPTGYLSDFEFSLQELEISDPLAVSAAAEKVRTEGFRRHFPEIAARRDSEALKKRSLYTVDDVSSGATSFCPVRIFARSSAPRPGLPEPDLSSWRSGHELDDRLPVLEASAAFLDGLKANKRPDDAEAYQVLVDLAPEFLKEFIRRDGLSVERYYNEAVMRAGEFRADRKTVPIIGTLFTPANYQRVLDGLKYAKADNPESPDDLFWLIPNRPWGYTTVLPSILSDLCSRTGAGSANSQIEATALVVDKAPRHIEEAFKTVTSLPITARVPRALEILFVPGLFVSAIVHAPVKSHCEFPVPLGFASFDERVIRRAVEYLSDCMSVPERL